MAGGTVKIQRPAGRGDKRTELRHDNAARTVQSGTHFVDRSKHRQEVNSPKAVLPLRRQPPEGTVEEGCRHSSRAAGEPLPHSAGTLNHTYPAPRAAENMRQRQQSGGNLPPVGSLSAADRVLQRPPLRSFGSRPCTSASRNKRSFAPANALAEAVAQPDGSGKVRRGRGHLEHRRLPLRRPADKKPRSRHRHETVLTAVQRPAATCRRAGTDDEHSGLAQRGELFDRGVPAPQAPSLVLRSGGRGRTADKPRRTRHGRAAHHAAQGRLPAADTRPGCGHSEGGFGGGRGGRSHHNPAETGGQGRPPHFKEGQGAGSVGGHRERQEHQVCPKFALFGQRRDHRRRADRGA